MDATDDIRDFVVRITELDVDGKVVYLGQVTHSPHDDSPPERLKVPFGGESFELVRLRLENAILAESGYRGAFESPGEKVLHQFGSGMFDVLFRQNEGIRRLHDACKRDIDDGLYGGLRIKMEVVSNDLSTLPWEFMFDAAPAGSGYLCLANTSPVLRHLGDLRRPPHAAGRKIKVLAMRASPASLGPTNAVQEGEILDTLSTDPRVGARFQVSWVLGDRYENLVEHINRDQWDVFHFIGHGGFDETADASGGYVVMGDGKGGAEKVFAEDLARVLRLSRGLRLAVLNCCKGAQGNSSASPGAALARAGIPAVVAMQYPIRNPVAIEFTDVFYKALLNGKTVEHALTTARVQLRRGSQVEWGIPVLYSRAVAGEAIRFWSDAPDDPAAPPAAAPTPPAAAPEAPRVAAPAAAAAPSPADDEDARRRARLQRVRAMFGNPAAAEAGTAR
jgi:hypothetical protein